MATIPPLLFVIHHLDDGDITQNGLALEMLCRVERAEPLGPCLWPRVGSRSTCFCRLSSREGVITPLYIWGAPPTSCGRAVNHSIPVSLPYSELDTRPRPDSHNATALHTWGLNQDTGFGPKLGQLKSLTRVFPTGMVGVVIYCPRA